MKKLNLKKPLALYEDFSASDISKPNQLVSPAGKTETASITVDKVVTKPTDTAGATTDTAGDKARAEIIQDVDIILTNLEALSKSITESILLEFNAFAEELTASALNEAEEGFMAKIMKSIKSAKSYSTVMGTYPGMKKGLLKAELTKTEKLLELTQKSAEMEAAQLDKLKAKLKEMIKAADGIAAKQKLRDKRDKLEAKAKAQSGKELEIAKAKLTLKLDNKIRDINAKIAEVAKDNTIESEDLKLRWAEQKLAIDDKHAMDKIEMNGKIEMKYMDGGEKNDELMKKLDKRQEEEKKKLALETKERKAAIAEDLKAYADKEAKEGEGDTEDMKKAKKKIREFITAHTAYLAKLEGTDFELLKKKKPTDEEKAEIKVAKKEILDAQKNYNALKGGLSGKTFGDAEGTDKEKGQETLDAIIAGTKEQVEDYKADLTAFSVDNDDDDKKFDEKKVKAAIDSAQTELNGLPEDATPQDKAKVKMKLLTAKIAMAKGKKEDTAELENELKQAEAKAKFNPPRVPGQQNQSVNYDLDPTRIIVEASLNGMQAFTDDDYKYLKGEAKKLGVKVTVDKDPYGDGTDEISFSGDKSAIMKLATISGHAEAVGDDNVYQIEESTEEAKEELPKKVKLYEGMSIADKFKALM